MSDEENTKEFENARPILERILARLDSMDARLYNVETRLQALEEQNERRAMETKPMWEKALAEIAETREEMRDGFATLARKLDVMNHELLEVKAEQVRIDKRMDQLEKRPS